MLYEENQLPQDPSIHFLNIQVTSYNVTDSPQHLKLSVDLNVSGNHPIQAISKAFLLIFPRC
jgi:hypothetical protein